MLVERICESSVSVSWEGVEHGIMDTMSTRFFFIVEILTLLGLYSPHCIILLTINQPVRQCKISV